jgi:antitoxin HicB
MSDLERGQAPEGFVTLDAILDREGIREEVTLRAFKRLLALTLGQAMEEQKLSKSVMARRMGTSRAQLDRILDPDEYNVTIATVARAAKTLGKRLEFGLSDAQ